MNTNYSDITGRLGKPLWWDESAAPRYEPFTPELCGVYIEQAALVLIACQDCGLRFEVAIVGPSRNWLRKDGEEWERRMTPTRLHFGDPPFHRDPEGRWCVGNSMNCIDIRVLQWWECSYRKRPMEDWQRVTENEVELEGEDAALTPPATAV